MSLARRLIGIGSLAVVIAALTVAACGGDDDALTIYSGRSDGLIGPLLEQFTSDTGIEVKVRYGGSAELAATILEEGGNSPADVFFAQDAGALGALAGKGRLQPLPDSLLERVAPSFRAADRQWVGVSGRARVLIYNTDRINESDLPASVFDFTDAAWRGRVAWAPQNGSFQAFVTALRLSQGESVARDWLEAMRENRTRAYVNNTAIVHAVAAGEIEVGLVNHYYLYPFLEEQGSGFKARNYFFSNGDIGGLINVAGAGILDSAENVTDARRFIEYLLLPAAQRYFADETFEYPLVEGVPISPELPPLSTLRPPSLDLNQLSDLQGTLELLQDAGVLP